jgi:hypothetical protein
MVVMAATRKSRKKTTLPAVPPPKLPAWLNAMSAEEREKTRPGRIKTLLEEIMYDKKVNVKSRLQAIDLLCKVMNMYRAVNEIYIVEPVILQDESGKQLLTMSTQPRSDMAEVVSNGKNNKIA